MIKIMLVDDDVNVAQLFGETLTNAGFDVDIFTDGRSALNSSVSLRYALVIADVNMPDIDGLSLMQMIRAQRPGMPYIFLSGQSAPDKSQVIQDADAYVLKIDGPKKLISKVIEVLARKGDDAGTSQSVDAV